MDKCWACCQSTRDWTWRGGLWKCQVLLQSNSREGRIERTFWKKIHALQHWHDCLSPKPQLNLIRISGQTQEDYCLSTWTLSFLIGQQSPGARDCSQNTATLHHAMPWGRAQEASCRHLGVPSSGKKFPWLLRHPDKVSFWMLGMSQMLVMLSTSGQAGSSFLYQHPSSSSQCQNSQNTLRKSKTKLSFHSSTLSLTRACKAFFIYVMVLIIFRHNYFCLGM